MVVTLFIIKLFLLSDKTCFVSVCVEGAFKSWLVWPDKGLNYK